MGVVLRIFKGLACGALAGTAAGFVLSWNLLMKTPWRDWALYLFVPVLMGGVIGLVSSAEDEYVGGFFTVLISGMGAGFFSPVIFESVFGAEFNMYFWAIRIPYGVNFALMLCGGAFACLWHFGLRKIFRC